MNYYLRSLLSSVVFCVLCSGSLAGQTFPHLLISAERLEEIRQAADVPGSSHAAMLALLQATVDANAADIIDGGNRGLPSRNYARGHLAVRAAMVYAVTEDPAYATIAYDALEVMYTDPLSGNVLPDGVGGKGLERAGVGRSFAMAYDLAYNGWTEAQRAFVRGKIQSSLDYWQGAGSRFDNDQSPYGSNWNAVVYGSQILQMIAIGEQGLRASHLSTIVSRLNTHMSHYGSAGWTQEGNYYMAYAQLYLVPAIHALRRIGNTSLDARTAEKNMHLLPMYAGMFDARQQSTEWGVGGATFGNEGWTAALMAIVPEPYVGAYRWFYDRHRGLLNPAAPAARFDPNSAGTVLAMLFYPDSVDPVDPAAVLPLGLHDSRGGYWFRSAWNDADDLIVSLATDTSAHGNAWDEADALQVNIMGFGSKFAGGPGTSRDARFFSQVTVDGQARASQSHTGQAQFFEVDETGGYAIAGGGNKFSALGLSASRRHLMVSYPDEDDIAIVATFDELSSVQLRTYAWQLNEQSLPLFTGDENGVPTFTLRGEADGYLKGWVLHPAGGTLSDGNPLAYTFEGNDADIWVVMAMGKGAAPEARIVGQGLDAELILGQRRISWNEAAGRMEIEPADDTVAGFTMSPRAGTVPLEVTFTPTPGATGHHWDFGDGTTSTTANPTHTFATGGVWPVTLMIDDGAGGTTSARHYFNARNNPPLAAFTATPDKGETPLTVEFDASASFDADGHALEYTWDFGDGSPAATGVTATHTYTVQGTYFAALTVTDGHGGTGGAVQRIEAGNQAPTPAFTHTSTEGLPPVEVSFDATGSTDPEGDPLTFAWDFGDGATAAGPTPSHTFTDFGTFEVVLTVDDGQGNVRSTTRTLRIQNRPPVPAFTFSPESGNAPQTINFNASASSDPEGQPLSFFWEFGDGATATGPTPTHTYTEAINTQVRLTVTDPQGASALLVKPLSILDAQGRRAPELPLSPEPDPALLPGVVFQVFNAADWRRTMGNINTLSPLNQGVIPNIDIRSGPSDRFAYRFTGYLKVPESGSHTFRARVRDNVILRLGGLTVIDTGRGKKFSGTVTQESAVGLAAGYHAFEIAFHASDSLSGEWFPFLEMSWSGPAFGMRAIMPEDLFWAPGLPEIDFLVSADPARMIVPETVNFIPDDPAGTQTFHQPAPGQPVTLNFEAGPSSVPGGEITNYLWDFGGGSVGAGRTASHTFGAGTHVVTLTVQTDSGALFTVGRTIRVVAPPARLDYSRIHAKRTTASGQFLPTTGPDMLFRGDPTSGRWLVDASEGFIELHFEYGGGRHAYVINEYTLTNPPAWNDRDPKDVVFSGTLDGVTWEVIDVRNDIDWEGRTRHTKSFPVANTTAYSGFRWDIVPHAQSPQGWFVEIHEIQIFGDAGAQPQIRAPVADFDAPAGAERRQPVTFDARAAVSPDGYPLVYFWDFGDGQTLHTADPVVTHRYFEEGTFQARLYVRDTLGNLAASSTHTIAVGPLTNRNPVASFEITDLGGLFIFDASASFDPDGDPIDFRWDFGNGIASVGPFTSHHFAPGLYAVTLTVTDDRGGRSTLSRMVDARPAVEVPSININFTTSFLPLHLQPYEYAGARPARNWNNLRSNAEAGAVLDNQGQSVPVSVTATGTRNFRNATQPVDNGLARMLGTQWFANGSSATYTIGDIPYALYDVYVYFAGARGSPPRTQRITVGGVSKFIRDDTGAWNGVLEESTATSAADAVDGPAYVVFRDVSAADLVISFTEMSDPGAAGIQIVSAEGANLRPSALFAATPTEGQAPVTVNFDGSASFDPDGFIETYEWDFLGDGSWVEGAATAQFTYLLPGTYEAALRVTDNRGDSDVATREIVITGEPPPNQPPVASITTSRLLGQAPHAVQLDASASFDPDGEIVAFQWDFTNNGTFDATGPLATATFSEPGEYTIRLRLTDDEGDHTESFVNVTVTEDDPDSRLIVDWGHTVHPGLIRGGADPVVSAIDLSGNGMADDRQLEFPFSLSTPLTTTEADYTDVPVYGGLRIGAFAQDEVALVERTFGGSFRLLPEAAGAPAGSDTRVSWGPSNDILDDRWMNIGNTATTTPTGTIAGTEGTFRYRSHTTAVVTNMTYDNPPESPHFGHAISQWNAGNVPNVFLRIEGRTSNAPDGDFIQISNTTSGSDHGATLVWWELPEAHNAAAVPLEVESLVGGAGAWAIAVRDGDQWYLGQPGQINVASLDAIQWTPYTPVDGDPVRLFANVTGTDTVGNLADLEFESRVFGNITAIGLYSERVASNQGRSVRILGFNVRPGVPEPVFQFHLAALWTKDHFLNGGAAANVVFSDDSFLRLVGLEVPGAPADVRWLVREGTGTYWVSEAVTTTAVGSPELTFASHREDGNFAPWNPLTGLRFDASAVVWEAKKFSNITAVGFLLDRDMAAPAPQALAFDRFEAALRLLPATSADGFVDWAAANNLTGGPTGTTGGLEHLLRYALGGDATTPAGDLLPVLGRVPTETGARLSLTFARIADPELTYAVWASDDLIDWGTEPIWSSTGAENTPAAATIEDHLDLSPGAPRFLRLSIDLP